MSHTPTMDDQMTGKDTPDPLKFAFEQKRGAHAGGRGRPPVAADQVQVTLDRLLAQEATPGKRRLLYLHVPFCRVRCTFCSFFQYAASRKLVDEYFGHLLAEIRRKGETPYAQSAPFHAVYIGGGTPTDLSGDQIRQLGQALRESFPLTPDCELTLEGRINGFDDAKFQGALEGGFNRFSFGVQSFNSQVRRSAKRLDDRDQVMGRLKELVAADQAPIVIDLLFGLPYQTQAIWQQDLQDMLECGVSGVDLYQLIDLSGTSMLEKCEKGTAPPPADTPTKATMYRMGDSFMERHHLRRLSCCHWASDNRERSLYNSMVKSGAEILPLGAGAGGNLGGYALMQPRDLELYQGAVEVNEWPVMMLMPKGEEGVKAALVGACDKGFIHRSLLGDPLYHHAMPLFEAWQKRGLAEISTDAVAFTLAGRFWQVNLCNGLLSYINSNPMTMEKIA
ncbi:heme anaerobic degradation radical SAM methyltransferase ChuW/HutW [Ferrimonas sp. YFM]|uniref:heme anaerobic degradation radical SAM methyltransferase ChuW/HutW n=1 Tax=Ferrimonas sp. YFM TaxID=3028878 RepID=UPI00257450D1|nr:heme anaerobic degradation radical SAM methyltransferase ChuW/HutW [Ferrimonas sp. YFM]BDY04268.1 putative heme utilization radical SAM enzyme HutW [Ferrimonas sp. YFM]